MTTIRGVAGLLEIFGDSMLMLGLFARPTAFILSGQMAVGYFISWAPLGFWVSFSTPNYAASIQNCFLFLSAAGPGVWSLDRAWRRRRTRTPETIDRPA